jgi:hypothetical protein
VLTHITRGVPFACRSAVPFPHRLTASSGDRDAWSALFPPRHRNDSRGRGETPGRAGWLADSVPGAVQSGPTGEPGAAGLPAQRCPVGQACLGARVARARHTDFRRCVFNDAPAMKRQSAIPIRRLPGPTGWGAMATWHRGRHPMWDRPNESRDAPDFQQELPVGSPVPGGQVHDCQRGQVGAADCHRQGGRATGKRTPTVKTHISAARLACRNRCNAFVRSPCLHGHAVRLGHAA